MPGAMPQDCEHKFVSPEDTIGFPLSRRLIHRKWDFRTTICGHRADGCASGVSLKMMHAQPEKGIAAMAR
jgi:hypothetical protein